MLRTGTFPCTELIQNGDNTILVNDMKVLRFVCISKNLSYQCNVKVNDWSGCHEEIRFCKKNYQVTCTVRVHMNLTV